MFQDAFHILTCIPWICLIMDWLRRVKDRIRRVIEIGSSPCRASAAPSREGNRSVTMMLRRSNFLLGWNWCVTASRLLAIPGGQSGEVTRVVKSITAEWSADVTEHAARGCDLANS